MIHNKKSQFYTIFVVFLVLIVLLFAYVTLSAKFKQDTNNDPKKIGEKQFALIQAYQEGEKAMLFIESAAKYSLQQSVYDLAKKGGYYTESGCGQYLGYNLWIKGVQSCDPSKTVKANLGYFMNDYLDEYAAVYPDVLIPQHNYNFLFKNSLEAVGIAKQNIELSVAEESGFIGRYGLGDGTFIWPTEKFQLPQTGNEEFYVNSCFGYRGLVKSSTTKDASKCHPGIDIAMPDGTPVYAAAKGTVTLSGSGTYKRVTINHGEMIPGYTVKTSYVHVEQLTNENSVEQGDQIAVVGSHHLHFEVILEPIGTSSFSNLDPSNVCYNSQESKPDAFVFKSANGYYVNPVCYLPQEIQKEIIFESNIGCGGTDDSNYETHAAALKGCPEYPYPDKTSKPMVATITPAASKSFGEYSVKPNFKTKINYDASVYGTLYLKALALSDACEKEQDLKQCASGYFEVNCDEGAERFFYNLVEHFRNCLSSENNECICEFDLEIHPSYDGKYIVKIYPENTYTIFELIEPELNIELKEKLEASVVIDQTNEINYQAVFENGELKYISYSELKKPVNDPKLVLKKTEKTLAYINYEDYLASNYRNLNKCSIDNRTLRLCEHAKDDKFMAYEPAEDKTAIRSLVYKFAVKIPDKAPPPPITYVKAYDKLISEQSVLLFWDKSPATDVVKYKIYYSENSADFEQEISSMQSLGPIDIDLAKVEKMEINSPLNWPFECDPLIYINCLYLLDISSAQKVLGEPFNILFEKNKLYHFLTNTADYYAYVVGLPEDKAYSFGVTAVDDGNNEINNQDEDQKMMVASGTSEDDLPPAIPLIQDINVEAEPVTGIPLLKLSYYGVTLNIDGTGLNDKIKYEVYCKEQDTKPGIPELIKIENLISTSESTKQEGKLTECGYDGSVNQKFWFAVIARDEAGNPTSDYLSRYPVKIPINFEEI